MTKDVLLSIKGLQYDGIGDGSDIETISPGEYFKKNDSHYVIFDEVSEGFPDKTTNILKWSQNSLNLTKRGIVNTHMTFDPAKKNITDYRTPFGSILIGIDTKNISVVEQEENIKVDIDYALDINYEYLADCRIHLDVKARKPQAL